MRAPPATTNELVGVLGVAALIAAVIIYVQTPKTPSQQLQPLQPLPQQQVVMVQEPRVATRPTHWEFGGTAPGWTSGRWLGEGDFKHFNQMDHPFSGQPRYAGHPFHQSQLPIAPPGPPHLGMGPPRY